jgi:hypothetical protein
VEPVHKTKAKTNLEVGHACRFCGCFGVCVGSAQLYVASQHRAFWTNSPAYTVLKVSRWAVFVVAIFYMDVKIIGRSSGRSATGAAAYRAGEKLHSIAHASYQSGEKIQGKKGKGDKVTHDYTKKGGVVHSEILLPDNAPPEYADRETLWNAVEASEKRKDAQLAREIIVALPRELSLQEQIEVVRTYVQGNFVSRGMIADFAIHDNEGNPHAHIMLTTRNVSREGFGLKNVEWNKKEFLLSYRKAWTHIINSTFARKGLDERIDHRTLKAQGLDREATIHLGHQAAALEKKGIATKRGDYNREIKERNETRAALNSALGRLLMEHFKEHGSTTSEIQQRNLNASAEGAASGVRNQKSEFVRSYTADEQHITLREAKSMEIQETMQFIKELQQQQQEGIRELQRQQQETTIQIIKVLQQQPANVFERTGSTESGTGIEPVPNEVLTKLKTANRIKLQKSSAPNKKPTAPKEPHDAQNTPKKDFSANEDFKKTVLQLHLLNEDFIRTEHQRGNLDLKHYRSEDEIPKLYTRVDSAEKRFEEVKILQGVEAQLKKEYKKIPLWQGKLKKEKALEIEQAERDVRVAASFFRKDFGVTPEDAPGEIERLWGLIHEKEMERGEREAKMQALKEKQEAINQEYYGILNAHPDREQLNEELAKFRLRPSSVRDRISREQIKRQMKEKNNTIGYIR